MTKHIFDKSLNRFSAKPADKAAGLGLSLACAHSVE